MKLLVHDEFSADRRKGAMEVANDDTAMVMGHVQQMSQSRNMQWKPKERSHPCRDGGRDTGGMV